MTYLNWSRLNVDVFGFANRRSTCSGMKLVRDDLQYDHSASATFTNSWIDTHPIQYNLLPILNEFSHFRCAQTTSDQSQRLHL